MLQTEAWKGLRGIEGTVHLELPPRKASRRQAAAFAVCRRPRKCGMTPPRQSSKYQDGLLTVVRVEGQSTKLLLNRNLGFVELTQCWIGS